MNINIAEIIIKVVVILIFTGILASIRATSGFELAVLYGLGTVITFVIV